MKKIFITLVAAALTMTACTSDDDDQQRVSDRTQITFAHPVMYGVSRAVGEINGIYPTTEKFFVSGMKYPAAAYPGWASSTQVFYNLCEEFAYDEQSIGKGWFSTKMYFFEDGMKYAFSAYSPSSIITTNTAQTTGASQAHTVTYDAKGLNLTNYYCGDIGNQTDLMYAPRIYDIVGGNMAHTGNGNATYDGVNLVFKHALASVHFRTFVDPTYMKMEKDIYGNTIATGNYKIKSIILKNVNMNGDFCENIDESVTPRTEAPAWTAQSNIPADGICFLNALKTVGGDAENDNVDVVVKTEDINSDIATLGKDVTRDITTLYPNDDITTKGQSGIMIPQTFAPDAAIEVRWIHKYMASGTERQDHYTSIIPLKDHTTEWLPGKRYIYNLVFKGNLILFKPAVDDWTDEDININIQ